MTTNTQTMKSQKVVLNVQTIIKLKSAVENAINNNINEFVFEGNKLLSVYANYLTKFLEGQEEVGYFLFRGSLRVPEKK